MLFEYTEMIWTYSCSTKAQDDFRRATIACFKCLALHLNEDKLNLLVGKALDLFTHKDWDTLNNIFKIDADWSVIQLAINFFDCSALKLGSTNLESLLNKLLPKLEDSRWFVRKVALECLGYLLSKIGRDSQTTVLNAVLPLTEEKAWEVRQAAFRCLVSLVPALNKTSLKRVIQALIQALDRWAWCGTVSAEIELLTSLAPRLKHNIPKKLVELAMTQIKTENWGTCQNGFQILSPLLSILKGNVLIDAVELSMTKVFDTQYDVRNIALNTIINLVKKLGSDGFAQIVVLSFMARLNSENVKDCLLALNGLSDLGPHLGSARLAELLPPVFMCLSNEDKGIRQTALKCVGCLASQLGPEHFAQFMPAVEACLSDKDEEIHQTALKCLSRLGLYFRSQHFAQFMPAVEACLSDKDEKIRQTALKCLSRLGLHLGSARLAELIPTILDRFNDSVSEVRRAAYKCLKPLLPQLNQDKLKEVLEALLNRLTTTKWMQNSFIFEYLTHVASHLDKENLGCLIKVIKAKLFKDFTKIEGECLDCIAKIVSFCEKTVQDEFYEDIPSSIGMVIQLRQAFGVKLPLSLPENFSIEVFRLFSDMAEMLAPEPSQVVARKVFQ